MLQARLWTLLPLFCLALVASQVARGFPIPFGFLRAPIATCAGVEYAGYCWYLSGVNVSCTATCSGHGGTTDGTINYSGSGAGANQAAQCQAVAALVDPPSTPFSAVAGHPAGYGCWRSLSPVYIWATTSPSTTQAAALANMKRFCSCVQ